MEPHQKHYRAKKIRFEMMDESDRMNWPADKNGRQQMARGLFGMELVSRMDYWLLLADDALDDTYKAPWAKPNATPPPVESDPRAVLRTLNSEQREAVRELLRKTAKGQFHSFCVALDQTLGGSTISVTPSELQSDESQEIHSPEHAEMHTDLHRWLKDFSILFGKDERYEG